MIEDQEIGLGYKFSGKIGPEMRAAQTHLDDALRYTLECRQFDMFNPPSPKPPLSWAAEWKRRLSNAMAALRGDEMDWENR